MFMDNPSEVSLNPVIVAVEQAREALLAALGGLSFGLLGDEESLSMLLALESVGRVIDGARVLSTTDVLRRSEYLDKSVATTAAAITADQTDSQHGQNAGRDEQAGASSGQVFSPCPQEPGDIRSIGEKRAGILRAVFEAAAGQPGTPTMGGAAPTVLVHIHIDDLLAGRGAGWNDGIGPPQCQTSRRARLRRWLSARVVRPPGSGCAPRHHQPILHQQPAPSISGP